MRHCYQSLIMCGLLFTAACGGRSLLDAAQNELDNALDPIIGTITLNMAPLANTAARVTTTSTTKTITTNLGYRVTLDAATLSAAHIQIVGGNTDVDCLGTATQDVQPVVALDLLNADHQTTAMATYTGTRASYCQYQWTLAAGKAAGSTLHLRGTWAQGAVNGALAVDLTDTITVADLFHAHENGELIAHPLHFHDTATTASATFAVAYDTWFDDIDFANLNDISVAATIRNALGDSLTQIPNEE